LTPFVAGKTMLAMNATYRTKRHPKSGLPVMVALKPPKHRVSAALIARLLARLL